MRFPRALILAALCLLSPSACSPTVDELRDRPVVFAVRAPVPFDTLANCLVARSMDRFVATPQIFQREGTAYVTLALVFNGTPRLIGEYRIARDGDGSTVEYRHRKVVADASGWLPAARDAIERCSKP